MSAPDTIGMSDHTQGELKVCSTYAEPEIRDADDKVVAVLSGFRRLQDSRRMVACWNACNGIDTKFLEALPDGLLSASVPYHELKAQRDALAHQLEIATDDMDAVECPDCGGHGRREVYRDVTHQLGTDKLPFWEECETCSGTGYCGPDAEKRAAIAKVKT